ncbi:MAG: phosphoribosylformylglycinamidine cyclo-ligase [Candidatus Omnitrophica bacterium]|nr:phosphoribosylformylglycinamidine cyclo-ligase [Candidatus Omnitrophota bacterium]
MAGLTYKKTGVDIGEAGKFVKRASSLARRAQSSSVLSGIGRFAACFKLDKKYKEPVLVSSTDGVGTKILIAEKLRKFDTIGIDLVAMVVNDIITTGARPLFFLDYFALGKLKGKREEEILKGIVKGCQLSGCSLIGGETAQLGAIYGKDGFDLAGFGVGIIEKGKVIDGRKIKVGDKIIGLASNGLHSNGYSLARKIFPQREWGKYIPSLRRRLGQELLRPTTIYVKAILSLTERFSLKGIANITGGGLLGNIPRILPQGKKVVIKAGSWDIPPIFSLIREKGKISQKEMFATFNLGIGMAIIVSTKETKRVMDALSKMKIASFLIGKIKE